MRVRSWNADGTVFFVIQFWAAQPAAEKSSELVARHFYVIGVQRVNRRKAIIAAHAIKKRINKITNAGLATCGLKRGVADAKGCVGWGAHQEKAKFSKQYLLMRNLAIDGPGIDMQMTSYRALDDGDAKRYRVQAPDSNKLVRIICRQVGDHRAHHDMQQDESP